MIKDILRGELCRAIVKHEKDDPKDMYEQVDSLIKKGANPYAEDIYGNTPFDLAIKSQDKRLVEILESAGNNRIVWRWSNFRNYISSLEKRKILTDLGIQGIDGEELLKMMIKCGHISYFKNEPQEFLCWAAGEGSIKFFDLAIKELCTEIQDEEWIKRVRNYINNNKTESGLVPLHVAVKFGYEDLVMFLINLGANVNVRGGNNAESSLHYAVYKRQLNIVKLLIQQQGAVINAKNKQGNTPLDLAIKEGDKEIEAILKSKKQELIEKFLKLAGEHPSIKNLLPSSNDVSNIDINNIQSFIGETLLHQASKINDLEIVELLIQLGANINATTNVEKLTPLHMAVKYGQKEIVELLVKLGADINAKITNGRTPLHEAVKCGYQEIVKLLIQLGADIDARDIYDNTPLHMTAWITNGNKEDIINLLIQSGANTKLTNIHGDTYNK